MPARAEASHEEFDELCDLDILQARTVRFKLQGEWHDLEPITTQRFFDFWSAMTGYQKAEHKTPEAENAAFLALLSAVCKSVTLEHVAQMTMVQKGLLLSHITSKIIGKSLSEPLEKKKTNGRRSVKISPIEFLSEACLMYGWLPEECLAMRATLFFAMLSRGRTVERRRNFGAFYELARVAFVPHMSDESRKEALQYFWDNSLTDLDVAQRDAAVEQMKRDATRTWMPSSAALAFTRRSR